MVSFNQVPIDIRVPGTYIEIDASKAFNGLSGLPTKILLIGQKTSAGNAAALDPLLTLTADQAKDSFGAGSQLANMCERLIDAMPGAGIEIHAIAQDDAGAGVAATGKITFGGNVTASGTLYLYIAGRRLKIAVAVGDTPANIATATVAAITANTDLPVTAAVNGGVAEQVDLTAKNKGVEANLIDIRINYYSDEETPAGLTVAIVGMSGGSGNPDITAVFTAIGDEWYTDMIVPYTDTANLTALKTELDARFGAMAMIDAHAYVGLSNTHANLITEGLKHNSPHVTFIGADSAPNPHYEWAAVLGGVAAFYAKQDPARQLRTVKLTGLLAPVITKRFTLTERDLLLRNGISTWLVDADSNVRIERIITSYRENSLGAADPSYLDFTTVKTVTYLRYDTATFIQLRYPNWKLADDGTNFARGQNVVTPNTIRASLIARFKQWEEQGLAENIEQFKTDLIVERDANDPNRINALIPPNIVNNLRVFAGLLQFRL